MNEYKHNCGECEFYHAGRCEELGEYKSPGEVLCSWFAPRIDNKKKTYILKQKGEE